MGVYRMRRAFTQAKTVLTSLSLFCLACWHLFPACANAEYRIRTIALSGETAPSGGNGDSTYQSFDSYALNDQGDVAFEATLSDERSGIFRIKNGNLGTVAVEGMTAPGSGGSGDDVSFASFPYFVLNDLGEVAFNARTVANVDGGDSGIYSTASGILEAVAFEGQLAPGTGGGGTDLPFFDFPSAQPPTINRSGEVAFFAKTASNDGGVFSTVGGSLQSVAFEGDIAPGDGNNEDEHFVNFARPTINDLGEVAMQASTTSGTGVFSTVGGNLTTVAFEGQLGPENDGGFSERFEDFRLGALANSGELALLVEARDSRSIYRTVDGNLQLVVSSGDILPGTGGSGADVPLGFFARRSPQPDFNEAGEVAFYASTAIANVDGGRTGIFSTAGGKLQAVAFEQQIALGSGGSGADVPFEGFFVSPILNEAGAVAFTGLTAMNDDGGQRGIYSTAGGALEKVIFEGEQIEVGPGDFRTIQNSGLRFWSNAYFYQNLNSNKLFNDRGDVAFKAHFADGSSGIFVAELIPEPGSAVLAAIGLFAVILAWRLN